MAKKARVFVTLKRGVLDPQGSAVNRALHAMGYGEVSDVRLGKFIEVTLDEKAPEARGARAARGDVQEAPREHRHRGLQDRAVTLDSGAPRARGDGMHVGIVTFPGSNCDHDVYHVVKHACGAERRRTCGTRTGCPPGSTR